jgi:hypothetical protein
LNEAATNPDGLLSDAYDRQQFPNYRGASMHEVSLVRLYTLRCCYLILAVGLGIVIWPSVIHHTPEIAIAHGIQLSLFAGLGLTAVLGLRYPVQMLPLLLFELIWKTIYLLAFALPLWSSHQVNAAAAADIQAVLVVVLFIPLIPWRYVARHYIVQGGDRWKSDRIS